ncbi:UDP-glucose dehydrogenase family protein [Robertmurraya siralis]|uniref:UDP-glucose dehydrogenase family protein n=1 Tax=Robertmurraya siralis TaxID=77777 RepID=UPI0010F49752|nr:UDP-glucose/GDP-mannose dehydrogenase family protein [Robertmurraya siralis]
MKIAIIGTGYVGLVTGVCLAEIGHDVTCIDIDEQKVKKLGSGISPIYEPGLEELLKKNISDKKLRFTLSHEIGLDDADAVYLAVDTPQSEDGSADLTYILQAAKDIARHLKSNIVVITKSTVPVGTNRTIKKTIIEHLQVNVEVEIVSNPEFLREGHAIFDTFHGDRIVIGADTKETANFVERIYNPFNLPVVHTDIESAELIKYASNAFLATKISFINEIANLCGKVGANITDVSKGMGMDQRIGHAFLNAGIGYGGSCFPKDTNALLHIGQENGYELEILNSVIHVNEKQPLKLVEKVLRRFSNLQDKKLAVLGLSFKPNTDDMRKAPSIKIINELISHGAQIVAYDPIAMEKAKSVLPYEVQYKDSFYEAIKGADACLFLTEWDEFKKIDLAKMKLLMKTAIVFDGRYCLSMEELQKRGFEYYTVDSVSNLDFLLKREAIYLW